MTDTAQPVADGRHFLLMKRGLYYRPENCGYTGIKDHAGRYFASDATPDSGVTAVHENEAPDFSPACFDDLARKHLQDQITTRDQQIAELRETCRSLTDEERVRVQIALWSALEGEGVRPTPDLVRVLRNEAEEAILSAIRNRTDKGPSGEDAPIPAARDCIPGTDCDCCTSGGGRP